LSFDNHDYQLDTQRGFGALSNSRPTFLIHYFEEKNCAQLFLVARTRHCWYSGPSGTHLPLAEWHEEIPRNGILWNPQEMSWPGTNPDPPAGDRRTVHSQSPPRRFLVLWTRVATPRGKCKAYWWAKTRRCQPSPTCHGNGRVAPRPHSPAWHDFRHRSHFTKFNRESQCLFYWRLFAKKRNYKLNLKKAISEVFSLQEWGKKGVLFTVYNFTSVWDQRVH
jgi:hypothetical protein